MQKRGCAYKNRGRFEIVLSIAIVMPDSSFAWTVEEMPFSIPFILSLLAAAIPLFFLAAVLLFSKRRRSFHLLDTIPDSLVAGYYFYDLRTGKEIISEGLKTALRLPYAAQRFADFKQVFVIDEYLKIQRLCEDGLYSLDNKQHTVTVQCHDRWFDCRLVMAATPEKDGETITVWFSDVSEKQHIRQRIQAENESLKQELQRLRLFIDAAPFPMWLRNGRLEITYANAAYKQLVGHKEEETVFAELHEHMLTLVSSVRDAGHMQEENKHIIVKGQLRLYHVMEVPCGFDGWSMGAGYDITRQEEVEKELEFHVSVQSDLLESSSSAMAVYGADTHLKFFNQAFIKLWELDEVWLSSGPTYGEILNLLREKRKLPEQINFLTFRQEHLRLFTDLRETYNEFFYLPDGRSLRMIAIPHAFGGLLFAYEDMTDRLALERSYNMLAAVQKATLDNLHEGIAVIGQNGRLKLYNPIYAKIWHHDMEMLKTEPHFSDLVEKAHYLYKHDNNWEVVKQRVLAMLSNRVTLRERVERTDGTVIDRLCIPLPDGATLMSYMDVTDSILVERSLREKNEALQEADRIKTEFLANMSYELRSPLTSIMGLSEALEMQYFGGLNERQKEYVQGIHASSHQLMSLINDILDLASIEAGHMELDLERFSIHAALSSVQALVKERIKEAEVDFTFDCSSAVGTMVGDERRVKQAIFKLLSNAIQFTPPGGKIILAVKEEDDNIVIAIQDTGLGIAIEEQHAIFDKFYRTETARMAGKAGAGLGLSVVKNFIELHQGKVLLESALNVGTTVRCVIPRGNHLLLVNNAVTLGKVASYSQASA